MFYAIAAVILHFYLSILTEVLPWPLHFLLSLHSSSELPFASSPMVRLLVPVIVEAFGFKFSVHALLALLLW